MGLWRAFWVCVGLVKDGPRWLGNAIKNTVTNHVLLNRLAPICYIFAISGIAGWGLFVALPFLYSDYPSWVGSTVQALAYFLAFQVFINWFSILLTDSTYHPTTGGASTATLPGANSSTTYTNGIHTQQNYGPTPSYGPTHNHGPTSNYGPTANHGPNHVEDHQYTPGSNIHSTNSKLSRKDATSIEMLGPNHLQHNAAAHGGNQMAPEPINHNIVGGKTGQKLRSLDNYFTWSTCETCKVITPPRTHHCWLCNHCVLKRDHHCYVASRCIGFRNLRHFSVFVFYATIATAFATLHALRYASYQVIPYVSSVDLFYPIAIVRGLFGFLDFQYMILIVLGWMCLGYLIFSALSVIRVYTLITTGATSFEHANHLDIYDTRDMSGKLKAVFGEYWLLNFIVPLHFVFPPIDDPLSWPHIKYTPVYGQYSIATY